MARTNLRRRGSRLLLAMIALFIGVSTLGLSITIISVSMEEYAQFSFSTKGYNLVVLTDRGQEDAIRKELADQPVDSISVCYTTSTQTVEIDSTAVPGGMENTLLQGHGENVWDVSVDGAPWDSQKNGAYLPAEMNILPGAELVITGANEHHKTIKIVGIYSPVAWEEGLIYPSAGILVSGEILMKLGGDAVSITVAAKAPPSALDAVSDEVGRALPQITIITSIDVDNVFSPTLKSLFCFAVSTAGLALSAGAVLIANAVRLTMIERQHETAC
jgi:hypothetical protein